MRKILFFLAAAMLISCGKDGREPEIKADLEFSSAAQARAGYRKMGASFDIHNTSSVQSTFSWRIVSIGLVGENSVNYGIKASDPNGGRLTGSTVLSAGAPYYLTLLDQAEIALGSNTVERVEVAFDNLSASPSPAPGFAVRVDIRGNKTAGVLASGEGYLTGSGVISVDVSGVAQQDDYFAEIFIEPTNDIFYGSYSLRGKWIITNYQPPYLLEEMDWSAFSIGMWLHHIEFHGTDMPASGVYESQQSISGFYPFTEAGESASGTLFEEEALPGFKPAAVNRLDLWWGVVEDVDFAESNYLGIGIEIRNNGVLVYDKSYTTPSFLDEDLDTFEVDGLANHGSSVYEMTISVDVYHRE